jgi:hypothetical protein
VSIDNFKKLLYLADRERGIMQKTLFFVFCFFVLQIISCEVGIVDHQPGATKIFVKNESKMQLLNVKWNGESFGSIAPSGKSEEISIEGRGDVRFDLVNNTSYRMKNPFGTTKGRRNEIKFTDTTTVIREDNATEENLSLGEIILYPDPTMVSVKNETLKLLLDVTWNGISFGNINPGGIEEKEIPEEKNVLIGSFFFKFNGNKYKTNTLFAATKYSRNNNFTFTNNTLVSDTDNRTIILVDVE